MGSSHSLALWALGAWLLAELLGAYMLRNWIKSGAVRHRHEHPEGISLPVLTGHAGLNLAGLSCWIGFVLTGSAVPAWLGICLLVPGIGLGVSTVSIWTPYPVARRGPDQSADDTTPLWIPHVTVAYSTEDQPADPIIAALGRELPECPVMIDAIHLVAQHGPERAWNWQSLARITLGP